MYNTQAVLVSSHLSKAVEPEQSRNQPCFPHQTRLDPRLTAAATDQKLKNIDKSIFNDSRVCRSDFLIRNRKRKSKEMAGKGRLTGQCGAKKKAGPSLI